MWYLQYYEHLAKVLTLLMTSHQKFCFIFVTFSGLKNADSARKKMMSHTSPNKSGFNDIWKKMWWFVVGSWCHSNLMKSWWIREVLSFSVLNSNKMQIKTFLFPNFRCDLLIQLLIQSSFEANLFSDFKLAANPFQMSALLSFICILHAYMEKIILSISSM